MIKQTLWIVTILMMAVSVLAAGDTDDVYKIQDQETNITVSCFATYSSCDNNTKCNLSLTTPTGNIALNKQKMTKLGDTFYYPITLTKTGSHNAFAQCTNGTHTGSNKFDIIVLEKNHNFGNPGLLSSTVLIGLSIIMLVFLAFFLINKNIIFGYVSATFGIIASLIIWTQGINIMIKDYVIPIYYQVPLTISSGVGFVATLFSVWLFWYASNCEPKNEQKTTTEYEYREEY